MTTRRKKIAREAVICMRRTVYWMNITHNRHSYTFQHITWIFTVWWIFLFLFFTFVSLSRYKTLFRMFGTATVWVFVYSYAAVDGGGAAAAIAVGVVVVLATCGKRKLEIAFLMLWESVTVAVVLLLLPLPPSSSAALNRAKILCIKAWKFQRIVSVIFCTPNSTTNSSTQIILTEIQKI